MAELTDEELALRVQGGQTHWFALLVGRYEGKLSRYARKFLIRESDAEDLVQEVFVKAFTNIQSFDGKRRFSPWIYRIAHNEFVNALKKRDRDPLHFLDLDTIFPHTVEEEPELSAESKKNLDESLSKIPEKYREPLVLYYYEDMDYREISDVLRIPVSTVGVRLARGREVLKKIMAKNDN